MKGTVLRPEWPAPAQNVSNVEPTSDTARSMSRITLVLADDRDTPRGGYDPYNTDAGRRKATPDPWRRKPKRD